MLDIERFRAAYFEAIDFTELGEEGQPPHGTKLTLLSKARATNACANFFEAYKKEIGEAVEQAGHDFWLTRQGHGTGFWDRPKIYGTAAAERMAQACKAIGEEHYLEWATEPELTAAQKEYPFHRMANGAGGRFAQHLARAWFVADSSNRRLIELSWDHLIRKFLPE